MSENINNEKSKAALREEAILQFWKENGIFEKTLEKESPRGDFVFYEGPPTANAKPALHHLEARAFKDVLPRYKTMRGFRVPRRAGWDTHGLPVELQIEKKLGLTSKKDIETYGVAAFNKECKDSVFTYIKDWEEFTDRIGYWVDKEQAYYTFDAPYVESLWHIVAKIDERGLLYKDYRVVPWCPRCGTGLSSHELAQEYQDVKDLSAYVKFKVKGEENTYLLAWTTTPWTLPGNVALAVGEKIDYVKVKIKDNSETELPETYIVAKNSLVKYFPIPEGGHAYFHDVESITGEDLVGIEYEPVYSYLKDLVTGTEKEKLEKAFKVYAADFVTDTDGTGIVHIAPMYGADDFNLGTTEGLPKFHVVDDTGNFIAGTEFLEGRFAKDEETAIEIIKNLAHSGALFKKEKYEHSYPHCWRCKTPLLYYARDSWYVGMSKLRDELLKENATVNWEPAHIKDGRFGEWLREVKDWAFSRERYWGTPLPIWVSDDGDRIVADSYETLRKYGKRSGNSYMLMRHAETESNVQNRWSTDVDNPDVITEKGKAQALDAAKALKEQGVDVIVASPFSRAQQTAQSIAEAIGYPAGDIRTDGRIGEWNVGKAYDGKILETYFEDRNVAADRYGFKTEDGESYADVMRRAGEFLYELEEEYRGKNILVVSHGAPLRAMDFVARGFTFKTLFEETRDYRNFGNAEVRELDFVPLPHNDGYELDPHRPYIDGIVLEKDGKEYRRVKEVADVWFDSGSMPFAQEHFPFEDGKLEYPADFISEAIDQTRGWFYTLMAVGVLMERGAPYKNVICLGHLLDADGKKMSKSVGNIVDPWAMMEKYGADTLRLWMYAVNQPGDSKNFDEKTVRELEGKVFTLLYNVISFYELYRDRALESEPLPEPANVLDRWILARQGALVREMTDSLEEYKLLEPVRALRDFIGDLSTWYLRRSRDRLKEGDAQAKRVLYEAVKTTAKLLAPFAPFAAEDIWQNLRTEKDEESVHLASWPEAGAGDEETLRAMEIVRGLVTVGLEARQKAGIKVRQPLAKARISLAGLSGAHLALIGDELNVRAVEVDPSVEGGLALDTEITPQLKQEGDYREFVRGVQDLRKKAGLSPTDRVALVVSAEAEELLAPYREELMRVVQADALSFAENDGEEVIVDGVVYRVSVKTG